MAYRALFLVIALGFLQFSDAAHAQSRQEWFSVTGVEVNTTAASAPEAKEMGIVEAQAKAFSALLERLVSPGQRALIPKADGANFVRDFSVERERVNGNRYIASLTVRFHPAAVRNFLNGVGIAVQEQPRSSRAALVVPVWQAEGQAPLLWEGTSPWRPLWKGISSPAVSLVLPRGTQEDQLTLTAAQAAAGDLIHMQALGANYQTADVMTVVATPRDEGRRIDVSIMAPAGTVRPFASLSYPRQEGETPDALIRRVAEAVVQSIVEGYQQGGMAGMAEFSSLMEEKPGMGADLQGPLIDILARIRLTGLDDWQRARNALGRAAATQDWSVVSLSRNAAEIKIRGRGTPEHVWTALREAGFKVGQESLSGMRELVPPESLASAVPQSSMATGQ